MAAPQASSRLELMQARFQQKQLQEKEQKLLQLYDQQQQRAYQVVQRGSAGSNNPHHGSTVTTVTRSSSSTHTTSTAHGGKVRQMFDERRQTGVKGIDRSYPLEPLDNKPRKQTNGLASQRNGNFTVSRQSVTVKRVARADVNSNLNGGKPVLSYHEEVTRESFGSPDHEDKDEFGSENHLSRYANGNGEVRIEEVLDSSDGHRMPGKFHLMEYEEGTKQRVRTDLEGEEFPEDLLVDVPDKLPKRTVGRKLSQAEARLERFKNANAKRTTPPRNTTTTFTKKRGEPLHPAKSISRITKTPSPEPPSRKVTEAVRTSTGRPSVPPSPSKSPETAPREFKAPPESKATRRPVAAGSKRGTFAGAKKSPDATDGQENGLHPPEPVAEGKQREDIHTRKPDAFVIDFDEPPPRERETAQARKPLTRKQSAEKLTSPTTPARPPSSVSSTSSGSPHGSKSKMAGRAKSKSMLNAGSTSRTSASMKTTGSYNAADNLMACKICGRHFATERVRFHEEICSKTAQKKRKQFDAMLFRVRGTELEPFMKKGLIKKNDSRSSKAEVKSDWRKKHEDFINAIRSAKQVQSHLAAGGKLSDLPPPPPSDYSDYIQCPHCGRKFNQSAAERHIPKCQNMLHNKPTQSRPPKPRR